jgi:D-apionolactonase
MRTLSRFQRWYGRDEPPVERRTLRAGPVTAQLEDRDLRYVRIGGVEVVRRLYVAVRDENWGTVPGELAHVALEAAEDRFRVRFDVLHRECGVDFTWRGEMTGAPDGTITYAMDGVAGAAFRYNRIGFCVLHPSLEAAGRPYRGETPSGPIQGTLPLAIGPQRIEGGTIFALFPAVSRLTIDLAGGVTARFDFEGDLFEMEDQRNWTDDSFKTYGTPLALPFPRDARPAQVIRQRVTVSIDGVPEPAGAGRVPASRRDVGRVPASRRDVGRVPASRRDARGSEAAEKGAEPAEKGAEAAEKGAEPRLELGDPLGRGLPSIGLGISSHGGALDVREIERLRKLRLDHLRVDLHLRDRGYPDALARAARECEALVCALELAVFVTDDASTELAGLAARLPSSPPISRFLVFHENEASTAGRWVRLARERLAGVAAGAAFAGGTNVYFTDLNRNRPEIEAMDAVAYSINPQVHAFDEASLVETLAAQAATVASACSFCGDRPLIVSPVTLQPRFNPNATGPEPEPAPGELPPQVDPRQMSLFGAVWTLGSVKYLAESGAASVTYYETTGWRGVMETEAGPPLPDRFPSDAGAVFPLYHVLADLAEGKPGELLACRSSDRLAVDGIALRAGALRPEGVVLLRVLAANMTPIEQRVTIGPLPTGRATVRCLDAGTAPAAVADPERFRSGMETATVRDGKLVVDLAPYAVARIDLKE